ncbi:hypothetical protein VTK73DRAFT_3508 [Phialemonium thermophilum]|uniref:Dicer-like protein 1 n=1 Tax=Phialemonium thermophilum TaxID=223376 RepID=A0ABR3WYJ8_9PEZI
MFIHKSGTSVEETGKEQHSRQEHVDNHAREDATRSADTVIVKEEDDATEEQDSEKDGTQRWTVCSPAQTRDVSKRKRADIEAFDLWIERNQGRLLNTPNQTEATHEESSAQVALRNLESRKIITSPRDYQIELFERAKSENTIAVLDTGSGKTLIAALLLRWVLEKELEDRARGKQKKIAFFLVDKVALVFQQHAMLECNLDFPIQKFCGELVDHIWSKEMWDKTFAENMAIVCTADILYRCLHHSFIQMDRINLLVFDEAHHTKKYHVYASIIKDFYAPARDRGEVPRILGMTASPVDALVDISKAALKLEGLLHSRIATVPSLGLQKTICTPKEETVVKYGQLQPPSETDLHKSLTFLLEAHELFRKAFEFTKSAASHLGPWCADRFWLLYLGEDDAAKNEPAMRIPGLHAGYLVGSGSSDPTQQTISFREQILTVTRFKQGSLNCLFATSVAEEGLDVPDCNVVIRFDLPDTMIQHIQSRGRARHANSEYIHMVEEGNALHTRKLELNAASEQALRRICEALPEDRKLTGNDFDMAYFLRKEKNQRQYTVPTTGARLNYRSSMTCLANFVASLPHPPEVALFPDYFVIPAQEGFQCEVVLPVASPVRSVLALGLPQQLLPEVFPFPLYFGKGRSSAVVCVRVSEPVAVPKRLCERLTAFTLKIFYDIFSKEYDATAAEFPYFLCPSRHDHDFPFSVDSDPNVLIDWQVLDIVFEKPNIECSGNEEDSFFADRFVTDPWDGSRKFFIHRRRHDLKPIDRVPEYVPEPSHRSWKNSSQDILNYSVSLWTRNRNGFVWKEDQPVVEAQLLPIRRNFLDETDQDEIFESKRCFLVLEPLRISPLPPKTVAMAFTFPAAIHRIESNLIALDMCIFLGLSLRPDLALEAFTKNSDNTDEHNAEQINFQRGMGSNYERLEFLGDSFLKLATTVAIFTLHPDKDEFDHHVERMLLICNKNLLNNALQINLPEYIRSKSFSRRTWYPEGLVLKKGKKTAGDQVHSLSDKSIADVCEAIIGAAYLTSKEDGNFDMGVRAVTALVKDKKSHPMTSWSDYYASYRKPEWQTAAPTRTQEILAEHFAARVGYRFQSPRLLRCAFMHPSYPGRLYEKLPSYQRLEFLGDALLDMVCVDYLFQRFPGADPQWLTEHKMAMVSNQFLGCLSVSLGFHRHILTFHSEVQKDVHSYVMEITEARNRAKEDAAAAGKDPEVDFAKDYWVQCANPPKCLPDVLEAYVGAVFVDSGYDYGQVQCFFDHYILPFFVDMELYDTYANKHPVTLLMNLLQSRFHCSQCHLLVRELSGSEVTAPDPGDTNAAPDGVEGVVAPSVAVPENLFPSGTRPTSVICGLRIHGHTVTHAVAASGRYAKTAAARKAVAELENLELDEFRGRFRCDCPEQDDKDVGG